jgi:hypothetical protein
MQIKYLANMRLVFYMTFAALLLCIITSCNNSNQKNEEEQTITDDSLQVANSIISEDSAIIFNNKADDWINQSLKNYNGNWKKFKLKEFWNEDSLQANPYEATPEFYKTYHDLLKWSPDSSYILDLGTNGATVVKGKDGKPHLENGDIDTEISLLDPKAKTKSRILFFGSAAAVINAHWIDSTQLAILGTNDEKLDQHPDTLLWIINTKEKFFRKYKW